MKSIALCENSLVEKSENAEEIKELPSEKTDKIAEEKLTNGNSDNPKSETVIKEDEKSIEDFRNGFCDVPEDNINSSEEPAEVNEIDNSIKAENAAIQKISTDSAGTDVEMKMDSLFDNKLNFSETKEILSDKDLLVLNVQKSSEDNPSKELEEEIPVITNSKDSLDTVSEKIMNDTKEDSNVNDELEVEHITLAKSSSEDVIENQRDDDESEIESIVLDDDENKENKKNDKTNCSENIDQNESFSSKCEIQVGECQTVADKDSIWIDKTEKDLEEDSLSSMQNDVVEKSGSSSDLKTLCEKKENNENNDVKELVENEYEEMIEEVKDVNGEVKSDDEGDEESLNMDVDESYINQANGDSEAEGNLSDSQVDSAFLRKRQISDIENEEKESGAKKKKLSDDEDEKVMKNEETENSSLQKDSESDSERVGQSAIDSSLKKSEATEVLQVFQDEKNEEVKLETSVENNEGKKLKAQADGNVTLTSSFLANLRGTLKSLTRSDLEELIVQKLCEVITERSNVGELRRKAQSLEQDQERWKGKVQSLTKLVKEMEMVMKRYMTEVHKQTKGGDSPVVTPLKVTRSVGLQVSFYSNANKATKPNSLQVATSNVTPNTSPKNAKPCSAKASSQVNPLPKNAWNKSSNQKNSLSQKAFVLQQLKKPITPRNEFTGLQQNRPAVTQAVMNNSCPAQSQAQGRRPDNKVTSVTQAQQQQQQQQQQNDSKIIDLTDDDDRQKGNVGKTQGPIRVINHLSQTQVTQNNRFAYILPASNGTPTGTPSNQNRQVLIATPTMSQPNRQLMCSMPPLLFKGGNVVQQPASQPQVLNQSSRVIFPKTLKHPAPLPQQPFNQLTRPNLKLLPPRPALKISKVQTGIVLSWNMSLGPEHAPISSYQLYAYQEGNSPPTTSLWKKVGDVKALPLPMACTLTQFMSGHKYHFAVRAVDLHSRIGPFSFPGTIVLVK